MVRGQAPRGDVATGKGQRPACGKVIDMADVLPAAPDCRGRVGLIALDQTETLAEKAGAAAGIEHPTAGESLRDAFLLDRDATCEIAELDLGDPGRPQKLGALLDRGGEQMLVERVAPELKGGHR